MNVDRVYEDLRVAISNRYVDSASRGLNEISVPSAFSDAPLDGTSKSLEEFTSKLRETGTPVTERAVVIKIMERWKSDTEPLASKSVEGADALKLLSNMRRLNRVFYEICARRLQDLIADMPE